MASLERTLPRTNAARSRTCCWLGFLLPLIPLCVGAFAQAKTPNDSHYQPLQWNLRALSLEGAWDITTGSDKVVVAVVDSGVAPEHPDLIGRLLKGRDFISDPKLAGDGDGWDDDPTDVSADPDRRIYHGTHVAGVIGASTNNNRGIAGIDWNCRILPVRAISGITNEGTDPDLAAAIRWAAGLSVDGVPQNENPANVINLSFGGAGRSQVLFEAVQAALDKGVIVVASAGNDGREALDVYPAGIPGVIAVSATNYEGNRPSYANYGKVVDVMAPGGDMTGKLPGTYLDKTWETGIVGTSYYFARQMYSYRMFDGTSVAAAHASGVIALVLSVKPGLSPDDMLGLLQSTAKPVGQCPGGCGAGLINALSAVEVASGKERKKPVEVVYEGMGCAVATSPAGTSGGALGGVLVLLSALVAGGLCRRWRSVGALLVAGLFVVGCEGVVEVARGRGDGIAPVRDQWDGGARPQRDIGFVGDIDERLLPTTAGEFCYQGHCGGETVCVGGICRRRCKQPTQGCNARAGECEGGDSCLEAQPGVDACLPGSADEGASCGGTVLCKGGLFCAQVNGGAASCVTLCDNGQCNSGATCEATPAGCKVCLP